MSNAEFIEELLHELAYRSDEGYPILSKQSHIYLISEILDEWGYGDIKNELIQNLTEEEKKYKSAALNKTVQYTDRDGNKKEGLVGSLLRLAADQPGRKAAEAALPAEGTPEREKINNELGGEGQPNRNIEKEKKNKANVKNDVPKPTNNIFSKDSNYTAPDLNNTDTESEVEIKDSIDRKKFSEKSTIHKDAPNGPTQKEILEDLNNGSLDKIIEYQNEVEINRAKGIAGAGGAVASEGESKYCNACNLDKDQWVRDNEAELQTIKDDLKNKKRTAEEVRTADALGLKSDSPEFLDALAGAELFSKQKITEAEADKDSVLYKGGKKGFADAKVGNKKDPNGAYGEWMKAAYFGSISTSQRLKESKIDTSQPHTVVQSTTELNDAVNAHLEDMVKTAETREDKEYYEKQLKLFKKFKKYHDTFVIGKDKNGRTAIVSISNKKDSQVRDPQNNTTPAQRLRFIKSTFGEQIADNVAKVIDSGVEKVSNAAADTIRSQSKLVIDDDIVKVCEEGRMAPYMGALDDKATDGKHRFSKFLMNMGKDWKSLSTKEKLELMQSYTNTRLYDESGNSRIISKSYTDDDGEVVDGTFYMGDDGKEVGPINSLGAAQIGLPFEPFGKISIKLGEFGANDETKRIKKTEKDLVTEVHTEVTNELFRADSEENGYHPEQRPDADNGKNTQAYILGTMKAMHIDTYVDMDDDDDAMLIQMGVNGVKPSMIRDCVSQKSGFVGDTTTSEGKKSLKEFILKRCRVTPGGEKISVMNGSKEIELFNDQWRTAGTGQKVASYFGKDMRECLQERAKLNK